MKRVIPIPRTGPGDGPVDTGAGRFGPAPDHTYRRCRSAGRRRGRCGTGWLRRGRRGRLDRLRRRRVEEASEEGAPVLELAGTADVARIGHVPLDPVALDHVGGVE